MPSYQLRLSLIGSKPLIWRRIIVPAGISAYEFHFIIQLSMGWTNSHLFEFNYGFFHLGLVDEDGNSDELGKGKTDMEKVTIDEIIAAASDFTYVYDMGDNWLHRIVVEEYLEKDVEHAICLEGENACPLEDIGGLPGHYEMLAILKNKFSKDRLEVEARIKAWDPEWKKNVFPIDAVNRQLAEMKTWFKAPKKKAKRKVG